jgi:hypothetical protein
MAMTTGYRSLLLTTLAAGFALASHGPPLGAEEAKRPPLRSTTWLFPFPPAGRSFSLGDGVVVDEKDGSVRLAHSVLVADEVGATDFRQGEALSQRVQAKKVFHLDSADVSSAELFLFGGAKRIVVNGKPLAGSERLPSTGWTRARVPPALLRAGPNEVVLAEGGTLLVEPGRGRGRSFKSTDGGRSWSGHNLGPRDNQEGEYLVRLRLGRYAPRGQALSPVLDLWHGAGTAGIAVPQRIVLHKGLAEVGKGQPEGTRVTAWLRTGATPVPDAKNWSAWLQWDRDRAPDKESAQHRWAQLRFDLATTRPQATPRLRQVRFDFSGEEKAGFGRERGRMKAERPEGDAGKGGTILAGPVDFVYQGPSPRLKLLRERYQLDKVVAPGQTEMEQLMLLRYWVRNQWHSAWGSHPAAWMPPWDALVILESKDQPDCLTMCTHYGCVFTQCCLALGWNARHCILDHHCVSEVWVDQHDKWVMMDAGNSAERADVGLHFERHRVPLSARELHEAYHGGKAEGITVCFTSDRLRKAIAPLCRPAPPPKGKVVPRPDVIPLADLGKYPVCQLNNYRRYAFPGRNDLLTSLYPGEREQGWSEYFYDGYWWVGDSPDDPRLSPEYSRHLSPSRPQDVDWALNRSHIHLCHTDKPGELRVDVQTHTPNLLRLERAGQGGWRPTPAGFVWKLQPGVNELRVRGVNHWGRAGREARVQVRWAP